MGKMGQMPKSEVTRLAKKQVRTTCLPLVRDVRWLKQTVAAMGKTVAVRVFLPGGCACLKTGMGKEVPWLVSDNPKVSVAV